MSLASRVNRLERHRGGPCPECGGRGWPALFVQALPGSEWASKPGDRAGCPRCGHVNTVKVIVLDEHAPDPVGAWRASQSAPGPRMLRAGTGRTGAKR